MIQVNQDMSLGRRVRRWHNVHPRFGRLGLRVFMKAIQAELMYREVAPYELFWVPYELYAIFELLRGKSHRVAVI